VDVSPLQPAQLLVSEVKIGTFDTSLRGYRPAQVDEYLAKLQRVMSRVESDLAVARRGALHRSGPAVGARGERRDADGNRRPSSGQDQGRADGDGAPLTERMDSILLAARAEAADVRRRAHEAAQAERGRAMSEIARLIKQRDLVLADLVSMRSQIEEMLPAPTSRQSPDTGRTAEETTAIPAARSPQREAAAAVKRNPAVIESTVAYRRDSGRPKDTA
jgi:DivIVA domain-containing protein